MARNLIEPVHSSELDVAIATVRIPHKMIGYEPVFRETFVLVGVPRWAAVIIGTREMVPEAESKQA